MRRLLFWMPLLIMLGTEAKIASAESIYIPVNGVLSNPDGTLLEGTPEIKLSLYETEDGTSPLWFDVFSVELKKGAFNLYLGTQKPLSKEVFVKTQELFLGVTVGEDREAGRIRLVPVPFAIESQYCHELIGVICPEGQFLRGWDSYSGAPLCSPVSFDSLTDVPESLSDWASNGKCTAGTGIIVEESQFSIDRSLVESWTRNLCYNSEAELTEELDDVYLRQGAANSVTNEMLRGEILPDKIAGTAWTAANHGPGSGLDADLLDGHHAADFAPSDHSHGTSYQSRLRRTVVVNPVDPSRYATHQEAQAANGDRLLVALASIETLATAGNPYLLKLEPGTYLLQQTDGAHKALIMKSWVDIEGSGEVNTKITSAGSDEESGTVWLADNAELRLLTVESLGQADVAHSIAVLGANVTTHAHLLHVSAVTVGGVANQAIVVRDSEFGLHWVEVTARDGTLQTEAIVSQDGSLELNNVTIEASSSEGASSVGLVVSRSETSIRNTNVKVSYSGGFEPFQAVGVSIDGVLSAHLSNVDIDVSVSGANGHSLGGLLSNESEANIFGSRLSASGGSSAASIEVRSSSADVHDSQLLAKDSPSTYGVTELDTYQKDSATHQLKLVHCHVSSTATTVQSSTGFSTVVAGCVLAGGPVKENGSPVICSGVVDENYTFSASGCP